MPEKLSTTKQAAQYLEVEEAFSVRVGYPMMLQEKDTATVATEKY